MWCVSWSARLYRAISNTITLQSPASKIHIIGEFPWLVLCYVGSRPNGRVPLCRGGVGVAVPLNFQEFNTITALIFAQLHKAFPGIENIDTAGIAKAMDVADDDWSKHKRPSGRSFDEVLAYTIGWLSAEGYIKAYGAHASENVMLTTKALSTMNAVPSGLNESLGTELRKAVRMVLHLNLTTVALAI